MKFRFFDPQIQEMPSDTHDGFAEPRLSQVAAILEAEPGCSVRELAERVSLSPEHLQRIFKARTGQQLGTVVVERRLIKAAEFLTSSNLSIKEIAHAVGYHHHSSFVRAFQRRYSLTPKNYRVRGET